jgi:hypothetical protein
MHFLKIVHHSVQMPIVRIYNLHIQEFAMSFLTSVMNDNWIIIVEKKKFIGTQQKYKLNPKINPKQYVVEMSKM